MMTDWKTELSEIADCIAADQLRLALLASRKETMPALALTEQTIVDALKADPAMAGRVMVGLGLALDGLGRNQMAEAANGGFGINRDASAGLQRLAVALAAASYRG